MSAAVSIAAPAAAAAVAVAVALNTTPLRANAKAGRQAPGAPVKRAKTTRGLHSKVPYLDRKAHHPLRWTAWCMCRHALHKLTGYRHYRLLRRIVSQIETALGDRGTKESKMSQLMGRAEGTLNSLLDNDDADDTGTTDRKTWAPMVMIWAYLDRAIGVDELNGGGPCGMGHQADRPCWACPVTGVVPLTPSLLRMQLRAFRNRQLAS
jgi:hypothetical protein